MKKLIFIVAVAISFTACHSTTEANIEAADSVIIKSSIDSIKVINDSLKVVDTIKAK